LATPRSLNHSRHARDRERRVVPKWLAACGNALTWHTHRRCGIVRPSPTSVALMPVPGGQSTRPELIGAGSFMTVAVQPARWRTCTLVPASLQAHSCRPQPLSHRAYGGDRPSRRQRVCRRARKNCRLRQIYWPPDNRQRAVPIKLAFSVTAMRLLLS